MDRLRAAIIGAGYFANAVHLPALSKNRDVDLVAICERDEKRLAEAADKYSIPARYTDYRKLLDSEKLDAVYIVVPPSMTAEVATAFMEAGVPTLLEKPPGRTSAETRRLCEVADRTGTLNVVAFNRRHSPVIRRAKDLLGDRRLRTVSARMLRYHRWEPEFVTGTGIHALDTLRFLGGEVAEVDTVSAEASDGKGGTNVVCVLRYESGAIGTFFVQTVCGISKEEYEIHAEDVSLFITAPQGGFSDVVGGFEMWQGPRYPLKSLNSDILEPYREPGLDGVYDEDAEIVACIREGRRSPNDVHSGLRTMLLAEAIAKGGKQRVEQP